MVKKVSRSSRLQPISPKIIEQMKGPALPPESKPSYPEVKPTSDKNIMASRHIVLKREQKIDEDQIGTRFELRLPQHQLTKISVIAKQYRRPTGMIGRELVKSYNGIIRDLIDKNRLVDLELPNDIGPSNVSEPLTGRFYATPSQLDTIRTRFDPLNILSRGQLITTMYVAAFEKFLPKD